MNTPYSLNIVVFSNTDETYDEEYICSQLGSYGHSITLFNKGNYIPLVKGSNIEKMVSKAFLRYAIDEVANADLLVLLDPILGDSFLAGVAHTSGVRTACISSTKEATSYLFSMIVVSYWCESISQIIDLANNWEDPIIQKVEE